MYKDKDGDVWYFANFDPPEHMRAHPTFYLIWANFATGVAWILPDGTCDTWIPMEKFERYCAVEVKLMHQMALIAGYK
jgi:hypothetical protein